MQHLPTAIRVLVLLSLAVPVVVAPSFIYPFVVPRVLVLRAVVEAMAALYVLLAAARWDRYGIRPTPTTVAFALYLLSFAVSTVLGVDPHRSLWDTHERMLGLYTIAHYVAYYMIVTTIVRDWRWWRVIFWAFLLVGGAVAIVGLHQRFGDPQFLFNQGTKRVSSTLGHPSYLGGLGAFTFFVGVLLAVRHPRNGWAIAIASCGAALGIVAAVISETRGTQIGLGVGAVVTGVCYLGLIDRRTWYWKALLALCLLAIVGGTLLYSLKDWEGLKSVPFFSRYYGMSMGGGTGHTRVMAWGMALEAAADKPVFGWGPNNYYYVHNVYYRPPFLRYGELETWFDNAHNVLLNTLSVQGGVGLFIYLALLLPIPPLVWRAYARRRVDLHLACIATGWLVTHLIHNVFVFENATSWLYFALMLAYLNAELRGEPEVTTGIIRGRPWVAPAAAGAAAVLVWFGVVQVARANRLGLDAVRLVGEGRSEQAIESFERSAALPSPHRDGVRSMVAEAALKRVAAVIEGRNSAQRQRQRLAEQWAEALQNAESTPEGQRRLPQLRVLQERELARADRQVAAFDAELPELRALCIRAYDELGENLALHPLDVRLTIGRTKLAQSLAQWLGDGSRIAPMEGELERAIPHSPRRQQLFFLLAEVKLALVQQELAGLEAALRASPEATELARYQGVLASRSIPLLDATLRGLPEGSPLRDDLTRAIEVYRRVEELQAQAEGMLRATIESDPQVDESWWRLALHWQSRGRADRAREVLDEAEVRGVRWSAYSRRIVNELRGQR